MNATSITTAPGRTTRNGKERKGSPLPPLRWRPDIWALLRALRYSWQWAVTMGIVSAAAAATLLSYFIPHPKPSYRAVAMVYVFSADPKIAFPTMGSDKSEFGVFQRTQIELVSTPVVLRRAVLMAEAQKVPQVRERTEDVIQWLERHLKVEFKGNSELLSISLTVPSPVPEPFTIDDPDHLTFLVDAVKNAYVAYANEDEKREREGRLRLLERRYEDSTERFVATLKAVPLDGGEAGQLPVLTPEEQGILTELDELRRRRRTLQENLSGARFRLQIKRAQEKPEPGIPEASVEQVRQALDQNPAIQPLRAQIAELRRKIAVFEDTAVNRWAHPDYVQMTNKLENLEKTLDARRKELLPSVRRQLRPQMPAATDESVAAKYSEDIAVFKKQLEGLDAEFANLQEKAKGILAKTEGAPTGKKLEAHPILKRLEFERIDTNIRFLKDEVEAVRVEQYAPLRVNPLVDAEIRQLPVPRRSMSLVVIGGLAAFLLAVWLVSFHEFLNRKFREPSDARRELDLPVLGSMPALPAAIRRRPLPTADREHLEWRNLLTQSVDAVRRRLLQALPSGSGHVVMITSARHNEGNTTLASHLAVSLARAGKRTLLVDADMLFPAVHEFFDRRLEPGFADVLRQPGEPAVQAEPAMVKGLWVLTAGQVDHEALLALSEDGMRAVFERWRLEYDVVLIDAGHVQSKSGSMLLADYVDAAIVCVYAHRSLVENAHVACDRLFKVDVPVIGVVVNGLRTTWSGEFET